MNKPSLFERNAIARAIPEPDAALASPGKKLVRRKPSPLALEQRFMFDGAAVDTAVDSFTSAVPDSHPVMLAESLAVETLAPAPPTMGREIAFVDTTLADWQSLAAGVRAGVEVVQVDAGENGMAKMLSTLEGQHDLAAIHILGHGADGMVALGSSVITAANWPPCRTIWPAWAPHLPLMATSCCMAVMWPPTKMASTLSTH